MFVTFSLLLALISLPYPCLGVEVTQTPRVLITQAGGNVALQCNHSENNYLTMLWYQQKPGEGLKLMIYSTDANVKSDAMEAEFQAWDWSRPHVQYATLKLSHARTTDSAVYFCAISRHSYKS